MNVDTGILKQIIQEKADTLRDLDLESSRWRKKINNADQAVQDIDDEEKEKRIIAIMEFLNKQVLNKENYGIQIQDSEASS